MMRDEIAPALRRLGLKGSGQAFAIPSESHWALVGFQKSVWGDSDEVRFTINLTVVEKAAWEAERQRHPYIGGGRPAPNVQHGRPAWCERIGMLLPGGGDHWWRVPAGCSPDRVVSEVVSAIRDHALPEMRLQMDGDPRARPPRWAPDYAALRSQPSDGATDGEQLR
jgi:hypothetical protein